MLETGTNGSKYQFIPNKSKFIPGTNPSGALSPLLRLKISRHLCWERREGPLGQNKKGRMLQSTFESSLKSQETGVSWKEVGKLKFWEENLSSLPVGARLDRSQSLLYFVPQDSHSQAGSARLKIWKWIGLYFTQERNMQQDPIWEKEKWGLIFISGLVKRSRLEIKRFWNNGLKTCYGAFRGGGGLCSLPKMCEGRVGAHSWVGDRMRAALLARVTWLHPPSTSAVHPLAVCCTSYYGSHSPPPMLHILVSIFHICYVPYLHTAGYFKWVWDNMFAPQQLPFTIVKKLFYHHHFDYNCDHYHH